MLKDPKVYLKFLIAAVDVFWNWGTVFICRTADQACPFSCMILDTGYKRMPCPDNIRSKTWYIMHGLHSKGNQINYN